MTASILRSTLLYGSVAVLQLLTACATKTKLVDHSFGFDAYSDSPGITVLDFRYGSSDAAGVTAAEYRQQGLPTPQHTSTTGPMPAGPDLYVKWRIDSTGEVFERTADLRRTLPANIDGHIVYFVVRGAELQVFLVTPERRDTKTTPFGPRKFQHLKVIRLGDA